MLWRPKHSTVEVVAPKEEEKKKKIFKVQNFNVSHRHEYLCRPFEMRGKVQAWTFATFHSRPWDIIKLVSFFIRLTSVSTFDSRKFIRWTCRPTLPQDCYWRNKFIFVAINVAILSFLMFVDPQLIMKLSCYFNKMSGRTEIKILLPRRSDKKWSVRPSGTPILFVAVRCIRTRAWKVLLLQQRLVRYKEHVKNLLAG